VVIQSLGANSVSSATVKGRRWLKAHAGIARGKTVVKIDGEKRTLPRADVSELARGARGLKSAPGRR
jgi:hypothetical protein